MSKTPAQLGFAMPAEWERHERIWLAWPHQKADWPDKFAPIPWVWGEIVRHISPSERVGLIVRHGEEQKSVSDILGRVGVDLKKVDFVQAPTNRVWTRDSGPIFITRNKPTKEVAMLDFKFNAWAKYPNWKHDNNLPSVIQKRVKLKRFEVRHKNKPVVLEGGAIDVNGKGTILVTEECLLSKQQERNPGFSRDDYEQVFADWLGAPNTVWLGKGIVGDDTHGHIDDITRFVAANTIVTAVEKNRKDDNYVLLQDNVKRLKKAKDQSGKPFEILELPMPRVLSFEGQRLPASYANFLVLNKAVIVPTFNDPNDRVAMNILAECFKGREIIGIHAVDLVWGLGTLHCLSQQQPA